MTKEEYAHKVESEVSVCKKAVVNILKLTHDDTYCNGMMAGVDMMRCGLLGLDPDDQDIEFLFHRNKRTEN